ncbi:glycosyltransferase [Fervidobacterium thailandense]|uniref:Glycosyl transferase family 1 domain-containing protein n=1 Tax=Fervidobacterium thailandense TaxID=1008305 RepID=A0A1E3G052_9BACT|nr:glycosyltransferase [Fervidobacterium thailandense]ODN29646.1 hypothetical protein A4H02_09660 [Fervidobacterium thailandense]
MDFKNFLKKYHVRISNSEKRAIISYITLPFYLRFVKKYMRKHQNRETAILISSVLKKLEIDHYVFDYRSCLTNKEKAKLKEKQYTFIMGLEPLFEELVSEVNSNLRIYFATGAYYKHQNEMIRKRTDEVNKRRKSNIPYYRLVREHKSAEIADYIIQIGSSNTILTYPEQLREKVILVRQNSLNFLDYDPIQKKQYIDRRSFLYFAGPGSILKGLDLLLEYFSKRKDLCLHIVGPIEKEFSKVYEDELFSRNNIHYHGFLGIDSKKLQKIVLSCSYVILPSASEGGVPGSVIHMVKAGMVPIVSKYAACDGIEEFGFVLDDITIESIHRAIENALSLTTEELFKFFERGSTFMKSNFNKENFMKDLENALLKVLRY